MEFKFYCRHCGAEVERPYGDDESICSCCNRKLSRKDTIPSWTRDARVAQLSAMHQLIANCNDENIYMSWIYLMPDGATEEDFIDIAMDDEMYNECWEKFLRLAAKDGMRW